MDSFSAMMILLRLYFGLPILAAAFLSLPEGSATLPKSKRQIYREQVLPSRGGKIPESAFLTDRLALNRLNKEGISIPDGVLLEHRKVHIHPHINQHDPEDEASLIRIYQRPDDRYVSPEGRYHNRPTVASTYLIRKPVRPENAMIRSPNQQFPLKGKINQPQRNQLYNSGPNQYHHRQQFVPGRHSPGSRIPQQSNFVRTGVSRQKYNKPAEVPSKKYLPVQQPNRNYLPARAAPNQEYFFGNRAPTVVRHPHPQGHEAPVSYQSVTYHSVLRPLELPNRELLRNMYYSVKSLAGNGDGFGSEEFSNAIDWPSLLKQYSQISKKINLYDQNSYEEPISHSQFFSPQVLGSIDSGSSEYYPKTSSGRYARKSKEISFTDGSGSTEDRDRPVKIRCIKGRENAVEDDPVQCHL